MLIRPAIDNDTTMNINHSNKLWCGLQTVSLRGDSLAADNIRLKEILKRRALIGKQRVVVLINSVGLRNSSASKPFFFLLLIHTISLKAHRALPSLLRYQQPMAAVLTFNFRNSDEHFFRANSNDMTRNLLLTFVMIILFCGNLFAQNQADTTAIKNQLEVILDRDQKTRTGSDSAAFMQFIDSTNLVQVESLIAKYGWMGRSFVGDRGNSALFFVIQHADLATQLKYVSLLQKSVEVGESRPSNLALMQDRILMRQGKNQIYGSQVVYSKTGEQIFYPIEDEKNVNIRRAKIGMQPLEEYAKLFGIEYKLPTQ
jgi:hypothetical protein